jgi:hypothetical protein
MELSEILSEVVKSKEGTLLAAALLWGVLWALQKVPAVGVWIAASKWRQRAAALLMATIPAVATALSDGATWKDAMITGVIALLAATGLHHMGKSANKPGSPVSVDTAAESSVPAVTDEDTKPPPATAVFGLRLVVAVAALGLVARTGCKGGLAKGAVSLAEGACLLLQGQADEIDSVCATVRELLPFVGKILSSRKLGAAPGPESVDLCTTTVVPPPAPPTTPTPTPAPAAP